MGNLPLMYNHTSPAPMRRLSLAIALFLLAGCTSSSLLTTNGTGAVVEKPVTSTKSDSLPLEQLPSELSIPHFSRMRLSGTGLTLDTTLETNAAYTRHAIHYFSNGLKITGVLLIPEGDGPFPLVIFNHGYIAPSVYTSGRGLKREQDKLARAGFAVLHTDYRGHAGSDKSPMTEDVYDGNLEYAMDSANAILAVRAAHLPKIDALRVGMLGHSLGGGVTLAVLTGRPDLATAAVLYAPVHADVWENFMRWRSERDEGDRTIEVNGTRDANPAFWNNLSPETFLDRIRAPLLLFQGGKDEDVPPAWSDHLFARLQELEKDARYVQYTNEGHEFAGKWEDFMTQTVAFFHQHLDAGFTAPFPADRVIKKPFGIFITPEDSPVSPERFRGYHTGADFEALPGEADVPVRTVCNGPLVYRQLVSGYGGVAVQRCTLLGQTVTVLYGHLRLSSIAQTVGETLKAGQAFAVPGTGGSTETDGERMHLHLAIHRGSAVELRGYVQKKEDLNAWIDPLTVLR